MLGFRKKLNIDFNTIFERYNAYVYKIVINESNGSMTKEDIEETVSDIFFSLWKNIEQLKDQSKIKSYLGTIARNTTRNNLRNRKQEFSLEENMLLTTYDDSFISEQLSIIHQELNMMDENDREIFMMYYYDNRKIREIASTLEMNVSTVKTRLYRIKKRLKITLKKGGF